ncbi:MAG: lipid-A-disaccharide synthase [Desulfobacterales bacterium]
MTEASMMIITGEASGDLHGANLVKAVHRIDPGVVFFGIGGAGLKEAGADLFCDIRVLSVMGLTEVLPKAAALVRALSAAKRVLRTRRPDVLILIDFPDFNLNLAKTAKRLNIPVLYYISPKVWAWRSGRVEKIRSRVDRLAIILPFEERFYKAHDVAADYVGHPLLDTASADGPFYGDAENPGRKKVIGLLPGSREKEVTAILPVMMAAACRLSSLDRELTFLVSKAPSMDPVLIERIIAPYRSTVQCDVTDREAAEIFSACGFLMAASGTVTLEAAIAGVPMVVLYKMSRLSYGLARRLVRLEHACLVNLIAEKEVVPELLQHDAEPKTVAQTVWQLLKDPGALEAMTVELKAVRKKIGSPGASERVARMAMDMVR